MTAPLGGAFWDGGSEVFVNKGKNGRWKELLSKEDSDKYEKIAVDQLGEECADWLMNGGPLR